MSGMRIENGVVRGKAIRLIVDGVAVPAFAGETIAAAMIAAGLDGFRRAGPGAPRGLYCAMGVCGECMVTITGGRRVRACLTDARDGLEVSRNG